MKKQFTLTLSLLVLLASKLSAQIYCESFDGFTVPANNQQHAFNTYGNGNTGFLQDWKVTNGTPAIIASGNIAGVNAYNGNQYALMAVCDGGAQYSEGLSLNYSFIQGQTYHISMAIRNAPLPPNNPTPIDIDFVLLQNPISFTYQFSTGCTPTPAIPSGAIKVDSIKNFSQNSWQVINLTISNLTADYSQLWIRGQFSTGSPLTTTFLCLDSFCTEHILTLESDCQNFDDTTLVTGNDKQHAFYLFGNGNDGFLKDWYVTSGTPAIEASNDIAGVQAYTGNQYALMAVCGTAGDWSEGLALKHSFSAGGNYNVSLAIRNVPLAPNNPTPIDVDFILLQDSVPFTYQFSTGCTPTPAVVLNSSVVHSISNYTNNVWSVITFPITNQTSNYFYLWIRSKFSQGSSLTTTFLCIDSVCFSGTAPTGIEQIISENKNTQVPQLYQNDLNPFDKETSIRYYLPNASADNAQLIVHDVMGKLVSVYPISQTGKGAVIVSASSLQTGVYLYSLVVNNERIATKRMMVVK